MVRWRQLGFGNPQNKATQANLASLYEVGRGVPRDLSRAYLWRLLSLDGAGSKQNDKLLALAQQMNSHDIAAAEHRASEWRLARKAAPPDELGISDAPSR
jgi:TPR repeat protein